MNNTYNSKPTPVYIEFWMLQHTLLLSARIASVLLFLFLTHFVIQTVKKALFTPLAKIPGPWLNAFSSIPLFWHSLSGNILEYRVNLHKKYGPIILVTRDDPKPKSLENSTYKEGVTGMFTVHDKGAHKIKRRVVSPAFSIKYLNSLEPLFKSCTQVFTRKIYDTILEGERTGEPAVLDLYLMMQNLALDIIGETAYGQTFDMVENGKHPLPHKITEEVRRILWFADQVIKARLESGKRRTDILQYLLDTQSSEATQSMRGLSWDDVRMEAAFMFFAGAETTANSSIFTVILLLQNPDCLEKLRHELDNALGCPSEEMPLADHEVLKGLPYLNACIWEGFRMSPIAEAIQRITVEDVRMAFNHGLHYSPEYWHEPNRFNPNRFINDAGVFNIINDHMLYPFSAGSRNCIGKNFGLMEMRLTLATLFHRFNVIKIPGESDQRANSPSGMRLKTERYCVQLTKRTVH
ncbi:cytochrome P450 [Endogone sp. FLAS-F59071]|nr:cytochrome P450 [Endogone sp. FLAS-F59071]|eukprot:RUS16985.1 cytochrome P450 [Endogone sp. FLAS-F59071]